jgi:hypothetical protein
VNEFLTQLLDTMRPAVLSFIEIVLGFLVPLLAWKVNNWVKAKSNLALFQAVISKITSYAETAVLDVGQTYVKGVRKSGEWNGEAAQEAKKRARQLLENLVGQASLKELRKCLKQDEKGINELLDGTLEQTVAKLKKQGVLMSGGHAAAPIKSPEPSER